MQTRSKTRHQQMDQQDREPSEHYYDMVANGDPEQIVVDDGGDTKRVNNINIQSTVNNARSGGGRRDGLNHMDTAEENANGIMRRPIDFTGIPPREDNISLMASVQAAANRVREDQSQRRRRHNADGLRHGVQTCMEWCWNERLFVANALHVLVSILTGLFFVYAVMSSCPRRN